MTKCEILSKHISFSTILNGKFDINVFIYSQNTNKYDVYENASSLIWTAIDSDTLETEQRNALRLDYETKVNAQHHHCPQTQAQIIKIYHCNTLCKDNLCVAKKSTHALKIKIDYVVCRL